MEKMATKMDSENESHLKRIRKPPLLLSQEESLAEKVKKYPCLFGKRQKTYKKRNVSQKFSLSKTFTLFSRFESFFIEVLKTKMTSCQILCRPS